MKKLIVLLLLLVGGFAQAQTPQAYYWQMAGQNAPPAGLDPDAVVFFTAVASLGDVLTVSETTAVNTLVVNMKAHGSWANTVAAYPMVGGTATSVSWNLINPATFYLTHSGSPTFNSSGITYNSVLSQYSNTHIVPFNDLLLNDKHIGIYSGTSTAFSGAAIGNLAGSNGSIDAIFPAYSGGVCYGYCSDAANANVSNTNMAGPFIVSRDNSSSIDINIRGTVSNRSATSTALQNASDLVIGTFTTQYMSYTCGFATIGYGLTSTQSIDYSTDIQTFATTLSR